MNPNPSHRPSSQLGRDMFDMFAVPPRQDFNEIFASDPNINPALREMFRPVNCAECGQPALRHEFARDWCLDCLGVVETEMNAMAEAATAQEKAVAEEMGRLEQIRKNEFRGTPHEL